MNLTLSATQSIRAVKSLHISHGHVDPTGRFVIIRIESNEAINPLATVAISHKEWKELISSSLSLIDGIENGTIKS